MNLQQLRYLAAVVDHGLNVSDAAEALFTSQPGISKQIRQLEDELGLKVFVRQGKRLASLTPAGAVVVATARKALADFPELVTLPCYTWNRCVLVPLAHPLAKLRGRLTLEALAKYPIITYDFSFTGRSQINAAFAARDLEPNVVLTALDADVIKTYVELGMGVGIVAQMAWDAARDKALVKLDASHLFAPSTTRLALRRNVFLRGYVYAFIALFAPKYDRAAIDAALAGEGVAE